MEEWTVDQYFGGTTLPDTISRSNGLYKVSDDVSIRFKLGGSEYSSWERQRIISVVQRRRWALGDVMLEHHQVRGVSMLELSRTVRPEFGGRIPRSWFIYWVGLHWFPHYGVPAQPLSTTYLITQRVRQTFTGRGKVFTLLGYYVSLGDTIPTEILASQVYQHA